MANNTLRLYQYLIEDYSVGNMYLASALTDIEARTKLRDKLLEIEKSSWEEDSTSILRKDYRGKLETFDDILTASVADIDDSLWDINIYDMSADIETVPEDYVVHIDTASPWGREWRNLLDHYPHDDMVAMVPEWNSDDDDDWYTEWFIVGRSIQSIMDAIEYPDLIIEREKGKTIHGDIEFDASITIYDDYVE